MEHLSVKAASLAGGATWGLYMLCLGWISVTGYAAGIVNTISSVYPGFAPGFWGGIIGGVLGFVDGAIGGAIFAFAYNLALTKSA